MERGVRIPLFKDKIEPYWYKRLCVLFNEQTKEIVQNAALEITAIELKRDNKLDELYAAKDAIDKMFLKHYQVCLECRGKGAITEYNDMYDDRGHAVKCQHCKGAGYLEKEKDGADLQSIKES